ncbi:glycosyltransferase [Fontivita pretiosa]|uniref:glycosyltransferase n=1 Tax=Fontivita pretiosa TaxID=2989684 RepID=UPI003D179E25
MNLPDSPTLLVCYALIGPAAWMLMLAGLLVGRARMDRLRRWRGQLPADPPHVTILVPAKDEAKGIGRCIESVLAQDYPKFDVIAIDDRSTDDTGAILDRIAARDQRLRVIHVSQESLPAGWLGKCHALCLGSQQASGQWLLFVDSDVTLEPNALSAAISLALARNYDALSVLTRLECHSFLERWMLPALAATWAIMNVVSLTNLDRRRDIAAANGQFFLVRRSAYEAVGGHAAVKDRITEDVELMRLLKARGFKTRLFSGAHLAATRMHSSLRQMFQGWARIYCGTVRLRPGRILAAMVFVVCSVLTVYPALAMGVFGLATSAESGLLLAASTAHLVLMTLHVGLVYRWAGVGWMHALLMPATAPMLLAVLTFALHKCRTGRITWRGTEFLSPVHKSQLPSSSQRS